MYNVFKSKILYETCINESRMYKRLYLFLVINIRFEFLLQIINYKIHSLWIILKLSKSMINYVPIDKIKEIYRK